MSLSQAAATPRASANPAYGAGCVRCRDARTRFPKDADTPGPLRGRRRIALVFRMVRLSQGPWVPPSGSFAHSDASIVAKCAFEPLTPRLEPLKPRLGTRRAFCNTARSGAVYPRSFSWCEQLCADFRKYSGMSGWWGRACRAGGGCREMSFMPLIPLHLPAGKEADYFLLNRLSYDISDSMAFE